MPTNRKPRRRVKKVSRGKRRIAYVKPDPLSLTLELIRQRHEGGRWSQESMALVLGVSPALVGSWEGEGGITHRVLVEYESLFGIPAGVILLLAEFSSLATDAHDAAVAIEREGNKSSGTIGVLSSTQHQIRHIADLLRAIADVVAPPDEAPTFDSRIPLSLEPSTAPVCRQAIELLLGIIDVETPAFVRERTLPVEYAGRTSEVFRPRSKTKK